MPERPSRREKRSLTITPRKLRLAMREAFTLKSVGLALTAYLLVAALLFGEILKPLTLAVLWQDRLGAPNWRIIVLACLALAALAFALPASWSAWKLSLFVIVSMTLSTFLTAIYVDSLREKAFDGFSADATFQHGFLRSIREAPKEFQFYLHGAALKDCVAYGWSYREMDFYRLAPRAAKNVVPVDWRTRCPKLSADSS